MIGAQVSELIAEVCLAMEFHADSEDVARTCRQRFDVMIEFYDRAHRVVPVLFLAAANRQDMIEAKADIVLPEPQHRLQIVRRKSDVDDVFCELHLPHH